MSKRFTDFGILYIDDEVKSLKYFEAIFENLAPIYIASSPGEGFALFEKHHEHIGVVISDKKMPNESGLELLARIRALNHKPLRFLVTAFSDLDIAVDALNEGLLYSYLTKPWDPDDLEHRLIKALGHFALAREREQLLEEKAEAFRYLMMADKAATIGILSTGLNHHLRNALTVMRTFHDLLPYQLEDELHGEPKDPVFWRDYHAEVSGQIVRMTSILSNLAEGTRVNGLRIEKGVNLAELMTRSGEIVLEGSPHISFSVAAKEDLPLIAGDSQKLGQMGRLLFDESRSTLSKGGEIEVRISKTDDGASLETIFIDNGKLIEKRDLERLFDPFFVQQNKPEELGTNLMACYLTVFYHGGTIRAEQTADGRNSIIFTLPVEPGEVKSTDSVTRLFDRIAEFNGNDLRANSAVIPS